MHGGPRRMGLTRISEHTEEGRSSPGRQGGRPERRHGGGGMVENGSTEDPHAPVKPHILYQLDRRADERRSPSGLGDIREVLNQISAPAMNTHSALLLQGSWM